MQRVLVGSIRRIGVSCSVCLHAMHRRPFVWHALGALLFAVLVWQLTYPAHTVLPLARLDGATVGGKSDTAIQALLAAKYADVPLTLTIADKKYSTTTAQAGVKYDDAVILHGLTTYSTWQRFIPFSLPLLGLVKNQAVATKFDDAKFAPYAQSRSQDCAIAPTAAGVRLDGTNAKIIPAQDGQICTIARIQSGFRGVRLRHSGVTVKIQPEPVKPDGDGKDMSAVLAQAQVMIGRTIKLKLLNDTMTIPRATVASWLTLPYDKTMSAFRVEIDSEKLQKYLDTAQKPIYIAPGTTYIHTTNGIETSRETGATGRGIDMDETAADVIAQLLKGSGTVQATLATVLPSAVYDQPYSADTAGLQKLLNDLVRNKGDYAISVRTLDDSVEANANGTKQYHPASTYKLFVAWAVLQRIDSGKLHWTDSAVNGLNVSGCFDTMIINSDNACGEYFGGEVIGWANLNTMLRGIGFGCTNLSTAWYTCANDETLFLHKLQRGLLLDTDQTARLLAVMKQQVYRDGIPDGVAAGVADKVGFLYGMLHDTAIVYDSHGTYALTILTDGSSWGDIADAAWQINAQLARMSS